MGMGWFKISNELMKTYLNLPEDMDFIAAGTNIITLEPERAIKVYVDHADIPPATVEGVPYPELRVCVIESGDFFWEVV